MKTGELSNNFGEELGFTGVSREVDGGAAVLLEMPLNAKKKLSRLVLETLSNEVVIGIIGYYASTVSPDFKTGNYGIFQKNSFMRAVPHNFCLAT